MLFYK